MNRTKSAILILLLAGASVSIFRCILANRALHVQVADLRVKLAEMEKSVAVAQEQEERAKREAEAPIPAPMVQDAALKKVLAACNPKKRRYSAAMNRLE